jgi:two-component system, OmpR family, response regulator
MMKQVRQANCQTLVILQSARGTIPEMLRALDIVADDYLTEPIHLDILLARLRSAMRRRPVSAVAELVIGSISPHPS